MQNADGKCSPAIHRTKRPLTEHGFKDATSNETQIKLWWTRWPNAMIGVKTGTDSGIWALDPDAPEEDGDADGAAYWAARCARHPAIFTHTHLTPGGGQHKLFKWDDARPITNRGGSP